VRNELKAKNGKPSYLKNVESKIKRQVDQDRYRQKAASNMTERPTEIYVQERKQRPPRVNEKEVYTSERGQVKVSLRKPLQPNADLMISTPNYDERQRYYRDGHINIAEIADGFLSSPLMN